MDSYPGPDRMKSGNSAGRGRGGVNSGEQSGGFSDQRSSSSTNRLHIIIYIYDQDRMEK